MCVLLVQLSSVVIACVSLQIFVPLASLERREKKAASIKDGADDGHDSDKNDGDADERNNDDDDDDDDDDDEAVDSENDTAQAAKARRRARIDLRRRGSLARDLARALAACDATQQQLGAMLNEPSTTAMFGAPLPLARELGGAQVPVDWPSSFALTNVVASRATLLARHSLALLQRAACGDAQCAIEDIMASTASALPARLWISQQVAKQVCCDAFD